MAIDRNLHLVDEILNPYREIIAVDFDGYRNHVYRVVNLCYSTRDFDATEKEKIQIAGSFHDIGIWTRNTLDYLAPSEEAARDYLLANGKEDLVAEVLEMIEMHHCIHSCIGSRFNLVESFRRADIADFSLGIVRMGISKGLIGQLRSEFPNNGFHKRLALLGSRWFLKHPFNSLPMIRR